MPHMNMNKQQDRRGSAPAALFCLLPGLAKIFPEICRFGGEKCKSLIDMAQAIRYNI